MIRASPLHLPSALALDIGELHYQIKLVHGQQLVSSTVNGNGFNIWLADEAIGGREGKISLKVIVSF